MNFFFSAALSGPVLFHPEGSSAGSQGRCCAKLYYGTVLGTLSLLSLAIKKVHRKVGQNLYLQYSPTVPFDQSPNQS